MKAVSITSLIGEPVIPVIKSLEVKFALWSVFG
jgi:hypothetical protein